MSKHNRNNRNNILSPSTLTDAQVAMEVRKRFGDPNSASSGIVPQIISERRVSLQEWQIAIDLAKSRHMLSRTELYRVYENAMNDLHLESVIGTRITKVQSAKFKLVNAKGEQDNGAMSMLQAQWYLDYLKYAAESIFYGYSLIELFAQRQEPTQVELLTGKKSYLPIKEVTLIPREHVRPELGQWLVNTWDTVGVGNDYTLPPVSQYYIGVGKQTDLGLLKKITPIALAKRYAIGAWGEYDEKLGIPFRTVTMQGQNKVRERLLATILDKMGSAGWAILHEGEKIELLQNAGSDVHKCFAELALYCDSQMSKAVLHQTGTTDEKAFAGSSQVHKEVAADLHEADRTFIEYLNNDELIPRLNKAGYPLQGYRYERDNKQEIPLDKQIEIDKILLTHYNVKPEYIAKKYDIPLEMLMEKVVNDSTGEQTTQPKSPTNIQDLITEWEKVKTVITRELKTDEGEKKKPNKTVVKQQLNSVSIAAALAEMYADCCVHTHDAPTMDAEADIEALLNEVFGKEVKAGDISPVLFDSYLKKMLAGVKKGLGQDLLKVDYTDDKNALLAFMRENVFLFSAAKSYQEIVELTNALVDGEGKVRSRSEFKKEALKLHADYSKNYLNTEYTSAVVAGQMYNHWQDIVAEANVYPNITYVTVGDDRVRASHAALNGVTLPIDHPFWDTYYGQNDFGCRCDMRQSSPDVAITPDNEIVYPEKQNKAFATNVGQTGLIFTDEHPYFTMSKADMAKVKKFAKAEIKKTEEE